MKWNMKIGALAAASLIGLTACGSTHSTNQPIQKNNGTVKKETIHGKPVTWHVFNNSVWSEKTNGLSVQIDKVAVTSAIPDIELGKGKTPAIKLTLKMHNTSKYKYDIHPINAVLTTSNGKHLKAAMFLSKEQKGIMKPGTSSQETVGYYLKGTHLNQLKWIKLQLSVSKLVSPIKRIIVKIDTGKIRLK